MATRLSSTTLHNMAEKGNRSRLLGMPLEVRTLIYRFVFRDTIAFIRTDVDNTPDGEKHYTHVLPSCNSSQVLRVCRLFWLEARVLFDRQIRFRTTIDGEQAAFQFRGLRHLLFPRIQNLEISASAQAMQHCWDLLVEACKEKPLRYLMLSVTNIYWETRKNTRRQPYMEQHQYDIVHATAQKHLTDLLCGSKTLDNLKDESIPLSVRFVMKQIKTQPQTG